MRRTVTILVLLIVVTALVRYFVSLATPPPGPPAKSTNPQGSPHHADSSNSTPPAPAEPAPHPEIPPPARPSEAPPEQRPKAAAETPGITHGLRHPPNPNPDPDPRVGRTPEGKTVLNQPFELSQQLHAPGSGPGEDVEILDQILGYYRKVYEENPVVHHDRAVIDALTGENPKGIVFFDPAHPSISPRGLLDRFGNPYYFHAISRTEMDIISAGPDGNRGTPDDVHFLRDAGREPQLHENR